MSSLVWNVSSLNTTQDYKQGDDIILLIHSSLAVSTCFILTQNVKKT